jgi:hypothetical protein
MHHLTTIRVTKLEPDEVPRVLFYPVKATAVVEGAVNVLSVFVVHIAPDGGLGSRDVNVIIGLVLSRFLRVKEFVPEGGKTHCALLLTKWEGLTSGAFRGSAAQAVVEGDTFIVAGKESGFLCSSQSGSTFIFRGEDECVWISQIIVVAPVMEWQTQSGVERVNAVFCRWVVGFRAEIAQRSVICEANHKMAYSLW